MAAMCASLLHQHPPMARACEGCNGTRDVVITHLRTGGSYAICGPCFERGRRGWFRRDSKADRIRALEQLEGLSS